MKSLLLDTAAWDLCLDANGNWALAADPYAINQNVATACRTFVGTLYFDTDDGIPYFKDVFDSNYPLQLLKDDLKRMAETVDGVRIGSVAVYFTSYEARAITGIINFETTSGLPQTAGF